MEPGTLHTLLMDLHRFVRDVDCGTAGTADEVAVRAANLQERLDRAFLVLETRPPRYYLSDDGCLEQLDDERYAETLGEWVRWADVAGLFAVEVGGNSSGNFRPRNGSDRDAG